MTADGVIKDDYTVTYFNNRDAAEATDEDAPYVKVDFKSGKYSGQSITKTFSIEQADIANAEVKWEDTEGFVYNGKEQYPSVVSATVKS